MASSATKTMKIAPNYPFIKNRGTMGVRHLVSTQPVKQGNQTTFFSKHFNLSQFVMALVDVYAVISFYYIKSHNRQSKNEGAHMARGPRFSQEGRGEGVQPFVQGLSVQFSQSPKVIHHV